MYERVDLIRAPRISPELVTLFPSSLAVCSLIPATTEGRVKSILLRPGAPVKASSVVMILTSQELETDLLNAEIHEDPR